MKSLFKFIVEKRVVFTIIFTILFVASAILIPYTKINYDETQYLPEHSNTTQGLKVYTENFGGGNATAMLDGKDIQEILLLKSQISAISGVDSAVWLDDIFHIVLENSQNISANSEKITLMLRCLETLPRSEDTTLFEFANSLHKEFTHDELKTLIPMIETIASSSYNVDEFDLDGLISLISAELPSHYKDSLKGISNDQLGIQNDPQMTIFLSRFLDNLIRINSDGTTLSSQDAMGLIAKALFVIPTAEKVTFLNVYQALNKSFSNDELLLVFRLIDGIEMNGLCLSDIDPTNPETMQIPVEDKSLQALAALRDKLLVSQQDAATFHMLSEYFDAIVELNMDGHAVSGQIALDVFIRLLDTLEDPAVTTYYDFLSALKTKFGKEEIVVVSTLINLFGSSDPTSAVDSNQFQMLLAPLGTEYQNALSGLAKSVDSFYKDTKAIFTIHFQGGDYDTSTTKALNAISNLSSDIILSGNAAASYYSHQNQIQEIVRATILMMIVVLVFLTAVSSSWFDPVLYIVTILVSIVLNLGSNLIFKNVSYLTESVAIILQVALSIDYAIFLLHSFKRERDLGSSAESAMAAAMAKSFSPISASSLTTIACFVTIMFMRYRLGFDMGVVMAKGILLSLLTVFLFLPGLIIFFEKTITRTEHKTLNIVCERSAHFVFKFRWALVILAIAIMIPSFYFSKQNSFLFGNSAGQGESSPGLLNRAKIERTFGTQEQLALLVPKDSEKELELSKSLESISGITSVSSWALINDSGYDQMLPDSIKKELVGASDYNNIVLRLDCAEEGPKTKELLSVIRQQIRTVFDKTDECYLLGNTAAAIDMENYTVDNYDMISLISLFAVALIVALTFKSLILPVILVTVIKGAIWINMGIPYLFHEPMIFIGYMIITNILLGATIDYAILFTSNYMSARTLYMKKDLIREAQCESIKPIFTSGGIFTLGGLILGITSSFPTVQQLGFAIMRGGICSVILSIFVLPALLSILDQHISWFTYSSRR